VVPIPMRADRKSLNWGNQRWRQFTEKQVYWRF